MNANGGCRRESIGNIESVVDRGDWRLVDLSRLFSGSGDFFLIFFTSQLN